MNTTRHGAQYNADGVSGPLRLFQTKHAWSVQLYVFYVKQGGSDITIRCESIPRIGLPNP